MPHTNTNFTEDLGWTGRWPLAFEGHTAVVPLTEARIATIRIAQVHGVSYSGLDNGAIVTITSVLSGEIARRAFALRDFDANIDIFNGRYYNAKKMHSEPPISTVRVAGLTAGFCDAIERYLDLFEPVK